MANPRIIVDLVLNPSKFVTAAKLAAVSTSKLAKNTQSLNKAQKQIQSSLGSSAGVLKTLGSRYSQVFNGALKYDKTLKRVSKTTRAANQQQKSLNTTLAITSSLFVALGGAAAAAFTTAAIKKASDYEQALIGLNTVAKSFGVELNELDQALQTVTNNGIIPFEDAATGLKNLLGAGLNLDQSVKLFNTLRDSAAANRRANITLGQQIATTTEGIKNQNSIYVVIVVQYR